MSSVRFIIMKRFPYKENRNKFSISELRVRRITRCGSHSNAIALLLNYFKLFSNCILIFEKRPEFRYRTSCGDSGRLQLLANKPKNCEKQPSRERQTIKLTGSLGHGVCHTQTQKFSRCKLTFVHHVSHSTSTTAIVCDKVKR